MTAASAPSLAAIVTDIPPRLDRLPWSAWHWRVVFALGITWILDGLEVTIVGALGSVLEEKETLNLSSTDVGLTATAYIAGAIGGALLFGRMSDALGRKRLFLVTLAVYLAGTALTAASWGLASFAVCRFVTGMGIGGEYSAMNSAIDELLPARVRGTADLAINGSYWIGTALGAALTIVLLDPRILGHAVGWRVAFALGTVIAFAVLLVRRYLPESPRWLLMHGRVDEAEAIVLGIEDEVRRSRGLASLPVVDASKRVRIPTTGGIGLGKVLRTMLVTYRSRALLGLSLMIAQAFFYNAIFFTYALTLTTFYGVLPENVGLFLLPFAAGNFLGPIVLGPFFDRVGRKPMIASTYAASGALLALTGWFFARGALDATTHTVMWSCVFFVASAAASSAYLTVSELFPVEMRALAIAVFYAIGTGVGGLVAPAVFGALIGSGSRTSLMGGYVFGGALMIAAAIMALIFGVKAEGRSLEDLAPPGA